MAAAHGREARGSGLRRTVAALALALGAGACGHEEVPPTRALLELERLVFVPPADCPWPNTDLSLHKAIVFDRFEFTHGDLEHYWSGRERRSDRLAWTTEAVLDAGEHPDWPAFMDFHEAEELALLRGMRLPTPQEWLHVAVGRRGFSTPWGGSGREYFANTMILQNGKDFSVGRPCSVGTFENGRSRPFGCYDLLGNVWEWVDGVVLGYDPPTLPGSVLDDHDDALGTMASILGGAFDTRWRPTYELDRAVNQRRFHARRVDKNTLSPSIGARMCADAEPYLMAKAGDWGRTPEARERVRAVAERWARDDLSRLALRALLAELRTRSDAPLQLAWLEEGLQAGP